MHLYTSELHIGMHAFNSSTQKKKKKKHHRQQTKNIHDWYHITMISTPNELSVHQVRLPTHIKSWNE